MHDTWIKTFNSCQFNTMKIHKMKTYKNLAKSKFNVK